MILQGCCDGLVVFLTKMTQVYSIRQELSMYLCASIRHARQPLFKLSWINVERRGFHSPTVLKLDRSLQQCQCKIESSSPTKQTNKNDYMTEHTHVTLVIKLVMSMMVMVMVVVMMMTMMKKVFVNLPNNHDGFCYFFTLGRNKVLSLKYCWFAQKLAEV